MDSTALKYPEDVATVRDTDVKLSGEASARLESSNEKGNASMHCSILPFESTKRYRIDMDVKTEFIDDSAVTYFGILEFMENDGGTKWTTIMGAESHNVITETQDWTHFSVNVSGFDTRTTAVIIYVHMSGKGSAWYDNIMVREILPVPAGKGAVAADVESGEVAAGQEIWLTTGSETADIYYTIDGSDPTTSNTRYFYTERPVIVTEDMKLNAVAVDNNGPGKVYTYDYTVSNMLIENGGFEDGAWQTDSGINCAVDTSSYHSGTNSLKITPTLTRAELTSNWVAFDTRYDYELSFWARARSLSGSNAAYATLYVNGGAGYYENRQILIPIENNSDWTEYKLQLNDLNYLSAQFCISVASNTGNLWIDDVKFTALQNDTRPVTILPSSVSEFGAIYYNSSNNTLSDIEIGAIVSNSANCKQNITIDYSVENLNDNSVSHISTVNNFVIAGNVNDQKFVDNGSEKLDLSGITEYGVHKITFTVTEETGFAYEAGSFEVTRSVWDEGSTVDWLGMGIHELNSNAEDRLELLRKAGVGTIRWGAEWSWVERSKGVYTFDSTHDELIELMQSKGMDVIMLLGECNPLYDNGARPTADADVAAFAEYCKATVEHYKELGIKHYEMWNEFDYEAWLEGVAYSGAADYTKIIKAAYPKMKEADPDCVVMNGCTSGVNYNFIKKMMDDGAYDYTDAISLHPYCYQEGDGRTPEAGGFIERCREIYDLVNSYGNTKNIKIWITEFGFHTAQDYHGQSEADSAMNIIRSLALASANLDFIERVYIYEEFDRLGINVRDGEHHFGVTHGPASTIPYSAKSAIPAMSAFAVRMAGATYETTHHYGNSTTANNYGAVVNHEYSYSDGRKLFALYDVDNIGRRLTVTLESNDVSLYDINGNTINAEINDNGELVLELDGNMVYMVLGASNNLISAELN